MPDTKAKSVMTSQLSAVVNRADGTHENLGVISSNQRAIKRVPLWRRLLLAGANDTGSVGDVSTVAFAGWAADGLVQAACLGTVATPAFLMQTGTGTTTPAQADTAIQTAISGAGKTAPGSPTLTHTTGTATIVLVGTVVYSGATPTIAVTEQATFGATGNAMTHHVFAAINISSTADTITFTETLTLSPVGP